MSKSNSTNLAKPKAFWFHYNKPASSQRKRNVLSVHWQGKCELVTDIHCSATIRVRHRNSQPYCVMVGRGYVAFTDLPQGGRLATITPEVPHA